MNSTLDITTFETWLWESACRIRGKIDAPIFIQRLSDIFDNEVEQYT